MAYGGAPRGSGGAGDAWGYGEDRFRSPSAQSARSRASSAGRATDQGPVSLPPLVPGSSPAGGSRPPSREDVENARKHLVLLKAKRQQRLRSARERGDTDSPAGARPLQRVQSMPPRPEQIRRSTSGEEEDGELQRQGVQNRQAEPATKRRPASRDRVPHRNAPPGNQADGGRASPAGSPTGRASPAADRRPPPAPAQPTPSPSKPPAAASFQPFSPGGGGYASKPAAAMSEYPPGGGPPGGMSEYPPGGGPPGGMSEYPPGGPPGGMSEFPPEEAGDVGELIPCEQCGRKFAEHALEKHARICKKVFMQKRKKFDSAANRLGELENAGQLIQKAHKVEKEAQKVKEKQNDEPPEAAKEQDSKKMPAWKKKSLEFRQAMLAAKAAGGDEEAAAREKSMAQELAKAGPTVDPSKVACPHCGRSFNPESAEKHINICVKMFGGKNQRLVKGAGQAKAAANAASGGAARNSASKAGMPPPVPGGGSAVQRQGSRDPSQRKR